MSISVDLRRISNLPGRSDRKVELSFRGFTHKTRALQCENIAIFNEHFRWPHYGKEITEELFSVSVYNCSKFFSNRLLGQLVISLQHVVTSGRLTLRERLTDASFTLTDIIIELEIRFHPLEGAVGHWDGNNFLDVEDKTNNKGSLLARTNQMERDARRLGQSLIRTGDEDEDDEDYDYDDDLVEMEISDIIFTSLLRSVGVNVNILEAQKLVGVNINPAVFISVGGQKKHTATQKSTNCPFYNENFQFEFQEAQQIFLDKVIEIKVFHRRTLAFLMSHIGTFKIDISTVYSQPDHRFYQKWAPLTDPTDTRSGVKGYVQASLSVLMKGDPHRMSGFPSNTSSGSSEDIEKHLLLPRGMPSERPWARFRVRIYRAEGLPTMEAGLMAKMSVSDPYVQVTFAGQQGETSVASATSYPVWNEEISFIEQFPPLAQRIKIQLLDDAKMGDTALATHFLDLQQISDPTRNGFNPTFGPNWVNLYGSPQNSTLGDVHQALNEGLGEGIFYRGRLLLALSMDVYSSPSAIPTDTGSVAAGKVVLTRQSASATIELADESEEAGVEVPESVTVEVEEIHPLPEGYLGQKEEFLLFASLFEVTMIDPTVGTKPLTFELSIGNYGKAMGIGKSKKSQSREELRRSREDLTEETHGLLESEDELDREEMTNPEPENRSVSSPMRPQPTEYDGSFKCIPLQPPTTNLKPCLYVWSQFEDHSFRLYQANWLSKMADRLEIGLNKVEMDLQRPKSKAKESLIEVLLELVTCCKQFSAFSDRRSQSRPNSLDKCRREFIKKNLVLLARQAVRARRRITRNKTKEHLQESRKILKKLRQLAVEPQSTIPDVFLWMLNGSKRLAYVRIPSHSILFSLVEEQKGRDCGHITTLYMKSPGCSPSETFAKLEVYLWLGLVKYSKEVINSLPEEFMPIYEEEEEEETERQHLPVEERRKYFQLRCHLYQGRGLMAADDDGLSDPFAKVIFSTQCQVTKVCPDTLSPSWCECLLFDRVLLEGTKEQFQQDPPLIIIDIYDHDAVGSPKPLGRAYAEPEFKTVEQFYEKPKLRFHNVIRGRVPAGMLLAAFELIELDYSAFGEPRLPVSVDPQELTYSEEQRCYVIPEGVRPVLKTFRIEVLFWGLRELKRVQLFEVERPQVRVECAGQQLESEEIQSYKSNPNFKEVVRYFDVELPEQSYLHPPLTVFVVEHRAFGHLALVGSHVVQNLMNYAPRECGGEEEEEEDEPKPKGNSIRNAKRCKAPLKKLKKKVEELEEEAPEKEELDWWSKYYASVEEQQKQVRHKFVEVDFLYPLPIPILPQCDLESEFSEFQDWLKVFPLFKGRAITEDDEEDEEERLMGKYKGSFLVYPIDPEDRDDTTCQITNGVPKNSPVKVLVRVYIVKASSLAPTDPNGKADPYIVVKVGDQSQDSKERYIPKHDGYNKWRDAKKPSTILAELCRKNGIPSPEYRTSEVKVLNMIFKIPPDAIPEGLLKKNERSPEEEAEIEEHASLHVLRRWEEMTEFLPGAVRLVPEHVEIRSLQNQDNPGLPQGYLHMWVDMFPTDIPAPPAVDIKPRLPEQYELRVIIWNTDDVFLDDVNPFTGDPSSDIYVKGWIKGLDGDKQETDVHFNSLTGEGNFNWRFVFRFDYLPTEKEVVYKKKESIFSLEESEFRQPAVLTLQVWDYDRISANDFLGSVELSLSSMVRPAKSSSKCTIEMAKDQASPRFSIFRAKKMKGWWPLVRLKTAEDFEKEEKEKRRAKKKGYKKKKTKDKRSQMREEDIQYTDSLGNTYLLMGKVEAELQLVALEQAEANPVGRGRKEPEPLEKPNRPTTSFNWFLNPMKTFVFLIWKNYKKYIIALVILIILTLFLVLILYTLPGEISSLIVNG
uniref:Fer-1-like protein 4 n=1 Tax=Cyprinodon variegatus TaxID=28743 RepID=A0A3Q2CA86_CYPVA